MINSIELVSKRLRVPDRWRGKIRFSWPTKLPEGSTSFASNTDTAAKVLLDAGTPEELAVAAVICNVIIDTEAAIAMEAVKRRIEGGRNE